MSEEKDKIDFQKLSFELRIKIFKELAKNNHETEGEDEQEGEDEE